MNELRDKILNKIVEPATESRSSSTLYGTVLRVNEKANNCDVSYVRQDGKQINKANVPILLSNKSIIDWFPAVKENILLQEKNNVIYIIGPAYSNYGDIRNSIKLKQDIFSESYIDVLGGFLF